MKPHERRKHGKYPYFKLARWSARNHAFDDGRRAYETEAAARAAATRPGRYRISTIAESGRRDGEPFDVPGAEGGGHAD